jgi:uncharacterized membrane protein
MTHLHVISGSESTAALPVVRKIGMGDLKAALVKGLADFLAFPTHVMFLSVIYPLIGLILARLMLSYDLLPLLFPLAAGFALVGPFAALGLYELSRRRELGLDVSWKDAFGARRCPAIDGILALGVLLFIIFISWVAAAEDIYIANFGDAPTASVPDFLRQVFMTPAGWTLIVVGNGVGFLFAVAVLAISIVSFPLLLDRDVGVLVAIRTSVRAVRRNPLIVAAWGLIVAALLVAGSLPFFVGLAVVMPVLGHSSWHLYRKLVESDPRPRPDYAAQFPAALFAGEDQR